MFTCTDDALGQTHPRANMYCGQAFHLREMLSRSLEVEKKCPRRRYPVPQFVKKVTNPLIHLFFAGLKFRAISHCPYPRDRRRQCISEGSIIEMLRFSPPSRTTPSHTFQTDTATGGRLTLDFFGPLLWTVRSCQIIRLRPSCRHSSTPSLHSSGSEIAWVTLMYVAKIREYSEYRKASKVELGTPPTSTSFRLPLQ